MGKNVSDGDGPGRAPPIRPLLCSALPVLYRSFRAVITPALCLGGAPEGEMNDDTGNHREDASQHRQPCIILGDHLTYSDVGRI